MFYSCIEEGKTANTKMYRQGGMFRVPAPAGQSFGILQKYFFTIHFTCSESCTLSNLNCSHQKSIVTQNK